LYLAKYARYILAQLYHQIRLISSIVIELDYGLERTLEILGMTGMSDIVQLNSLWQDRTVDQINKPFYSIAGLGAVPFRAEDRSALLSARVQTPEG
jgi:hypothetical protein